MQKKKTNTEKRRGGFSPPPAAKELTPQDWEAVGAAPPSARDPLFDAEPEERYRELRRQIALEAAQQAAQPRAPRPG